MSPSVLTAPTTALAVLYGSDRDDEAAGPLASSLVRSPVMARALGLLPGIGQLAPGVVAAECARVAAPVLRIDVGSVALSGWRTRRDLVAAARITAAQPGTTEVIPLRHHRLKAERHPRLAVFVDGQRSVSLWFTVSFEFDVTELAATIEGGRLVNLRSRDTQLTVSLSTALHPAAKGVKLAETRARVDVPHVVQLGQGIPFQRLAEAPMADRLGERNS